ncbi:androgen-dependent TFPI-regulating protein-like [Plodia interpunctella]|uniref:androgen-dependent TFPI-regulating protein-like n=1 Tax=Plodia interpunctella TaxID=58824 RepID=UPI002368C06B|nr:androgen-dependent TFPI-regulating protein-like [Plodia interpunctella]
MYKKNSDVLTKCRLWLYSLAYIHLAVMSVKMLKIDFRSSAHPEVWVYQDIRFKLITCWFNLATLAYLPTSLYCEWRELHSQGNLSHVRVLNKMRNLCFTSILLPVTIFSDLLFWRLWNKDRELVAPASVDELAPFWTQHCMHTVSLVFVVLDLILCPRKIPKNFTLGLSLMFLFLGTYTSVCVHALSQGQYVYPVIRTLSRHKLCLLVVYVFLEHYFYYLLQWRVIDILWSKGTSRNKSENNNSILSYIPTCKLALNKIIPILRLTKSAANTQS